MLPLNVLADNDRAVIIDWECAGILPYPCALVRFLAYSGETPDYMYRISGEDREFAAQYYYEKLIMNKGISHDEYIRTLRLFFLKEYIEWICYARENHDTAHPEYQKYYEKCRTLAEELGFAGKPAGEGK